MDFLPVFLRLHGVPVVLVGGGTVATRKARLLARAGAQVRVVAPDITRELQDILSSSGGEWRSVRYVTEALAGARIVIAATPSMDVNRQVYADAVAAGMQVNVVDAPDLCTFIFPAIVDRSPLIIAISSSASSPVVARWVRRRIETMIPAAFGQLASFVGRFREHSKAQLPDESQRRRFWERAIEGPIGNAVLAGREQDAERQLLSALDDPTATPSGEVYLIGAGPGDPDLMTFKALRLLQAADVILYDRLVSPGILELARRDAERIYVGKSRAQHAVPQAEINQRLLQYAQAGKCVARLKGGDPFVFGRGAEEIELLAAHGIPFQVVPGITAATGCASYAGIPLTHRELAHSVRFIAGYLQGEQQHPWSELQNPAETLVFYMALQALAGICASLIEYGRSPQTPAALVDRGTTPEQQVICGTLATLPAQVAACQPEGPALLIIGDVVTLQSRLHWYGVPATAKPTPP